MPTGTLFVVATPIGNLEDITARAISTLQQADLIAAEDTRHSGRLLKVYEIETPAISYHDHNEKERASTLVERLMAGQNIALITDAGTPCVSDPGYRIVRLAREHGVPVVAVPGASAVTAALSISGLASDTFTFHGFFPKKQGQIEQKLAAIQNWTGTHVFYESPNRLVKTLQRLAEAFPTAEGAVARELTKAHEECRNGLLSALAEHFAASPVKGECVIMVHWVPDAESHIPSDSELQEMVAEAMTSEQLSRRDAVRTVATRLGIPRNQVYRAAGDKA